MFLNLIGHIGRSNFIYFIYSKEIVAAHLTILSMPAADLAPPIGSEIVYFMCSTHIEKLVKEV
jgi:hypothetical protein